MFDFMSRRSLLAAIAPVAFATSVNAAPRGQVAKRSPGSSGTVAGYELGLIADSMADQSSVLQAAIDQSALKGVMLQLPPGRIRVARIALREGSRVVGSPRTVLQGAEDGPLLIGEYAHGVRLERLRIEGTGAEQQGASRALIEIRASMDIALDDLTINRAGRNGLYLEGCSGRVRACRIAKIGAAALWAVDSLGLEIVDNVIEDCADNGILVWRSAAGDDGALVAQNRIARIGAASGGSGQNGNGVNVFRAGRVRVSGNHISDCAYSAVRGNAASDIQILGNNVARIGEVALYAEFGFEGALIAQNVVDDAAAGISVTNFNEGGRLAVIHGNLVRNLRRREAEPVDKRGEGISVEADAAVTGNTIEGAPAAGIMIGWGRHMRNVNATGNVIRKARVGVMITNDVDAGNCLVAQNLISDASDGAIRLMDHGRPMGDDLVVTPPRSSRIIISGNMITGSGA
ncbi:MAG: TIGR03808 family TAT-translocated repetitive protein [Hyphomicrobiaceae bacterium]